MKPRVYKCTERLCWVRGIGRPWHAELDERFRGAFSTWDAAMNRAHELAAEGRGKEER